MPFYRYEALDKKGKHVSGTIDAASLQEAKDRLRSRGLMPSSVKVAEALEARRRGIFGLFQRRVDPANKIRFTKQLGVLLRSGVPLVRAIEMLSEQFEGRLQRILLDIKDELQAGESFANSLAKYPRVFSSVYIQLVRAGEATGKLENILIRLNEYLEKAQETKKRFRKAIAYPITLLSLSVALIVGLLIGLVPMFAQMFKDMNIEPPDLTKMLMNASTFLKEYYFVLIVGIVGVVMLFFAWKATARGKRRFDELGLRLPLVSYLAKTKVVVQFSSTLGMLLDSGVNLAEALDIVCNIIDNTVLIESLKSAREKIIKEGKIAHYLKETGIFPPIASYMISTGEESGELAGMLLNVGSDYDVELRELIDGLISKITPILMLIVGGIVIFMVIGLFLPIFDFMEKIKM